MEYVDETLDIIRRLKEIKNFTVYLYTARWSLKRIEDLFPTHEIVHLVDGIHFTLHQNSTILDVVDFEDFQELIGKYKDKSFRLYIHPSVAQRIRIQPNLWRRIEMKPFSVECPLPEREVLFILER